MLQLIKPPAGHIQRVWGFISAACHPAPTALWCIRFASTKPASALPSSSNGVEDSSAGRAEFDVELLPKIALVGRPNVGKSALFNRLTGRRVALVHDTPESHVTRDWREGRGRLADLRFTIIDTCGVEPMAPADSIQGRGTELTGRMLRSVDLALLVIDSKEGVVGPDEGLAQWLASHVPRDRVLLLANKAEGAKAQRGMDQTVADCYRLGYGDPVAVSATTAEGMADLYVALQPHVDQITAKLHGDPQTWVLGLGEAETTQSWPARAGAGIDATGLGTATGHALAGMEQGQQGQELEQGPGQGATGLQGEGVDAEGATGAGAAEEAAPLKAVRLAIVGLPNVGKSTLLNRLLGEERCVTGPEAGLTRDPVMATLMHGGRRIELVDTAGYVGQTKVAGYDDVGGEVASKARHAGLGALASSHVVALVVDAAVAVKSQKVLNSRELSLVSQVVGEGKSLVVVANKMDALPGAKERNMYITTLRQRLDERLQDAGRVVVVEMAAHVGKGVERLMPAVMDAHACWSARVGTGLLNRWLKEDVLPQFSEGGGISRQVQRIKYITQVQSCPPTYVCFVVGEEPLPQNVHSFLAGRLREAFDMRSTPIRFWFRYRVRSAAVKPRRRIRLRQPALPPRRARAAATTTTTRNSSANGFADNSSSSSGRATRTSAATSSAQAGGGAGGGAPVSPRAFMQQRAEAAGRESGGLRAGTPVQVDRTLDHDHDGAETLDTSDGTLDKRRFAGAEEAGERRRERGERAWGGGEGAWARREGERGEGGSVGRGRGGYVAREGRQGAGGQGQGQGQGSSKGPARAGRGPSLSEQMRARRMAR